MDTKSLELEFSLLHSRICAALSDPKRIMILYLLSKKGMFVNDISEALDVPQSTVSRHLRILRERSLVVTERQGTNVLYMLQDPRIIEALDLLREIMAAQLRAETQIANTIQETNSSGQKE